MYIYDAFELTPEYKTTLIEFLKHNANTELGGYRIFDGAFDHLQQNPEEFADTIFGLKGYEKDNDLKLSRFLEIGFAHGMTNTILHKFFKFEQIVAVDLINPAIGGAPFKANLRRKNIILIPGDSTSESVVSNVSKFGPYDLILIDANHEYEYVKKDFYNYIKFLAPKGIILMHDISFPECPGVMKFWEEIKAKEIYKCEEFINTDYLTVCGTGMVVIKEEK